MRTLGIAMFLTGVVFVAFVIGITTQATIPLFSAFCLWTPVAWFTGWAVGRSGIQISVNAGGYATSAPQPQQFSQNGQSPVRRKRQPQREEFQ